uniref:Uncharacterized protein n=1 Tax=Manihot esculenta TaxID=3983 RepID=A0A2C9U9G7_MANES
MFSLLWLPTFFYHFCRFFSAFFLALDLSMASLLLSLPSRFFRFSHLP